MTKKYTRFTSPLGEVVVQANAQGITGVWFETHTTRPDDLGAHDDFDHILKDAVHQLHEYFDGKRTVFDLPISADGTEFQNKVWQALTTIPYGETWSYQDLADAIGSPKSVRAVGAANGKNPISVIVPCHRVIGKDGKLTGYAGGVARKKQLLILEGIKLNNPA